MRSLAVLPFGRSSCQSTRQASHDESDDGVVALSSAGSSAQSDEEDQGEDC
jgi:hypothetical protein